MTQQRLHPTVDGLAEHHPHMLPLAQRCIARVAAERPTIHQVGGRAAGRAAGRVVQRAMRGG